MIVLAHGAVAFVADEIMPVHELPCQACIGMWMGVIDLELDGVQ